MYGALWSYHPTLFIIQDANREIKAMENRYYKNVERNKELRYMVHLIIEKIYSKCSETSKKIYIK